MKLLTRSEEMLLLSVWRLQENAYGVTIREQLHDVATRSTSFGALFVSLDRLTRKGHLESYFSAPLPKRGAETKRGVPIGQRSERHPDDGLRARPI